MEKRAAGVVEEEEESRPSSRKSEHMNRFHKIYTERCGPRFAPHARKKMSSKKAKGSILVLRQIEKKPLITLHRLHNQ